MRNFGKRVGLFLGGVALLAIGIPLVMAYLDMDAWVPKLGGYVFLVPLFGLAMTCMAFGKLETTSTDASGKPGAERGRDTNAR